MKEEGNGDGFMSVVEARRKATRGSSETLPERVMARPKWEFTSIHIIIINVDAGEKTSRS